MEVSCAVLKKPQRCIFQSKVGLAMRVDQRQAGPCVTRVARCVLLAVLPALRQPDLAANSIGNIAPESHFQLPPKPVSCSVITIDATQSITSVLSKRIGLWSNTLWYPTDLNSLT